VYTSLDKVEIGQLVHRRDELIYGRNSSKTHVEKLFTIPGIALPYLKLCAGDMGFTSALTYDFEVYSAAQDKWLEVSSVSKL